MRKLIKIPPEYMPSIEELPGELSWIAETIEVYKPGHGVEFALFLAQVFGGQELYIRRAKDVVRRIRDDAIRAEADQGVRIKDLAVKHDLGRRQLNDILKAAPSQDELKKKQINLW